MSSSLDDGLFLKQFYKKLEKYEEKLDPLILMWYIMTNIKTRNEVKSSGG